MFINHTVIATDTVAQLAIDNDTTVDAIMSANSSVFDEYRLEQQARYISVGKLIADGVLIFPGDVLLIPKNSERKQNLKNKSGREEILIIEVDGKEILNPINFKLSKYYDACSDNFNLVYPADYTSIDLDIDNLKNGLPNIDIYVNQKLKLSGQIEHRQYTLNPTTRINEFAGRSSTRLLEKSSCQPNTPTVFKKMTIKQIAEKVISPFGIGLDIDDSISDVVDHVFDKVNRSVDEKPFIFISRLAKDLKIICSGNDSGNLELKRFVKKGVKATFILNSDFLKLLGVDEINLNYDTTNLFGSYVGKLQSSEKDNISKTKKSDYLNEISTTIKKYENIESEDLQTALNWDEQKIIKDFYNLTIPYPSWKVPETPDLWDCGDEIQIIINEDINKKLSLMIKNIIFELDGNGIQVAQLSLVPSSTYI